MYITVDIFSLHCYFIKMKISNCKTVKLSQKMFLLRGKRSLQNLIIQNIGFLIVDARSLAFEKSANVSLLNVKKITFRYYKKHRIAIHFNPIHSHLAVGKNLVNFEIQNSTVTTPFATAFNFISPLGKAFKKRMIISYSLSRPFFLA